MTDQNKPTKWCIPDEPELLKQICEKYNATEEEIRNGIEQCEQAMNVVEARQLSELANSSR